MPEIQGQKTHHLNVTEVRIDNVSLEQTTSGELELFFNIAWDESFRNEENWDAAWVFIKIETDSGWSPVKVSPAAGDSHAPRKASLVPAEDGMGAFIYRDDSHPGTGSVFFEGVMLSLVKDQLPKTPSDTFTLAVCALRMVYIPQGAFWAGDPKGPDPQSPSYSVFYDPSTSPDAANRAYQVASEDAIDVASSGNGKPMFYSQDNGFAGDQKGPIPKAFPKGYGAFYIMRNQVTQGEYAHFLNLVDNYTLCIRYQWNAGSYRYTIWSTEVNPSIATRPRRACNWLSWGDATAFACWAGLRPMTELEFEKACRGPADPVVNEFAWGNDSYDTVNVIVGSERLALEVACGNCNVDNSNTTFHGADGGAGPLCGDAFNSWRSPSGEDLFMGLRGEFTVDAKGRPVEDRKDPYGPRHWSGSTYYNVKGMSGNLWELCVSVGNPKGRSFTGKHGNGVLVNGAAPADLGWPGIDAVGMGFRGGSWYTPVGKTRLADRCDAAGWPNFVYRSLDTGFRGARTAPATAE